MDDEPTLEMLSSDDHREVWDETETKFWDKFTREQQLWNANHEQKYRTTSTELRCQLSDLTGRRNVLNETRTRMARDLMKIEDDLRIMSRQCDAKSEELTKLGESHRSEKAAYYDHLEWQQRKMTNFFRKKRGERLLKDTEDVPESFATPPTKASISTTEPMEGVERHVNGTTSHAPSPSPHAPTPISEGDRLVDVVDADDNVIGPVQRIEPWNHWVEAVMKLPVQRPVQIRRGRRFTEEHLSTIYERSEAKGVKWLSCMIQATGKIQDKRCASCDKNQGAFEKCIIVGGDVLSKCGNCEWNRQGCHGASGETVDLEAVEREEKQRQEEEHRRKDRQRKEHEDRMAREEEQRRAERQREAERRQQEERQRRLEVERREQEALVKEAVDAEAAAQSAQWKAARADQATTAAHAAVSQPRRPAGLVDRDILMNSTAPPPPSLPEPRPRQPLPGHAPPDPRSYRMTTSFTPANARSRPPSSEMLTPGTRSLEHSPQPSDDGPDVPLTEITRDNLVLRHDGTVYTYPECMVGVPVAKIHPDHPYWDPEWKNVRSEIVEAKERWEKKHQAAIDAQARNEKTGSSKYQIGRQVNRGTKILEFLDDESQISPYQLLGKRFMHSSKGGITSYDTLFRLCETLSELSKFNLDITPVDWMRHRLHEIMMDKDTEGEGALSLPKIVHDFYHDPKLTALRHKHGFKNIGRPSGQAKGTGRSSLGSLPGSVKSKSMKRKSTGSFVGMTRDYSQSYSESPLGAQMIIHDEGPFLAARSQQSKRPRIETDRDRPHSSEDPAEFTDRDTEYDEPLRREDFRLWQVQSRMHASSPKDTQYWSWNASQRRLEHRVRQVSGGWGSLSEPYDFSLRLEDVVEMSHDLKTSRVYIQIPPTGGWRQRGDLMVEFRRLRTLKRFLGFCQVHGVRLKELPQGMLSRWEDFKSDGRPTRSPEVAPAHPVTNGPLPPPASMLQRARYSHGLSASPDHSPRM